MLLLLVLAQIIKHLYLHEWTFSASLNQHIMRLVQTQLITQNFAKC